MGVGVPSRLVALVSLLAPSDPFRPRATLTCEDVNGNAVYSKAIKHTDFPLPEIALYFTNNVILLPSEN
jgi:hypothetical protein